MQQVDDPPIETIHLYVVREDEQRKRSSSWLPLFFAIFCLAGMAAVTIYSASHPSYEHETIRVPAIFLPMQTFTKMQKIIPTGVKTIPATDAHGELTLTNGSVIEATLPQGMIFTGKDGTEIVTDTPVFIPAGSAAGYGFAIVSAHALIRGKNGNIPSFDIDRVEGSSIYIRNLTSFHGGKDSYSVPLQVPRDRQTAFDAARAIVITQEAKTKTFLAYPCNETTKVKNSILGLSWACQFVKYTVPSYMRVTHLRLVGKSFFVDVMFVQRPRMIHFK